MLWVIVWWFILLYIDGDRMGINGVWGGGIIGCVGCLIWSLR